MDEKPMLVGWDDGKIYLYLDSKEYCVSDEPELIEQIIALCQQYFKRKSQEKTESDEWTSSLNEATGE